LLPAFYPLIVYDSAIDGELHCSLCLLTYGEI
jgi:hypothetical protein